ncbi:NAD-dependent epimerase/dehydratase family protein [Aeromonas sp. 96A]|uniref:NAD-dependent epimerase/dehydratase family protein n=1 Tax=Aeromonas sp. 96A TaxID=3452730 RepID=UPI003F7AD9A6
MRVAFIGATSQIATDLIVNMDKHTTYDCILYSRNPDKQAAWVLDNLSHNYKTRDISLFENDIDVVYDIIINFVGVGDPVKAKAMGRTIFDITKKYDDICIKYIEKHTASKYIFLSSGAVYGNSFCNQNDDLHEAKFSINQLDTEDWYGLAKLNSEAIHRSLSELNIYDLRVFGYFSRTQNVSGRFLLSDVIRTIINSEVLLCSSENIVRDYIHPVDFFQLVNLLIAKNITNRAFDCYSMEHVDKLTLLAAIKEKFGLQYKFTEQQRSSDSRKGRLYYYPRHKMAAEIGYIPVHSSLDSVLDEMAYILNKVELAPDAIII